ncbi:MAG: hypothetical protein HW403_1108 [Dehalococcoidia bacterium]|nr:hypothetical protein [Dehalococcoidia bacterium]
MRLWNYLGPSAHTMTTAKDDGPLQAQNSPIASVIIPNWNGEKLLPDCLDSLRRQTFKDFEVIVVDNASRDTSLELLSQRYPETQVISMDRNYFFSGAVNEGVRRARGEIMVFMNNDTEADPQWLEELVMALEREPRAGMATSKMLLFDRRNVINSAGDFYGKNGVPGNRGVWEVDHGQYDSSTDVFGACAGAAAFRRSMLEEIGLFDEDFVGYCEDVDLSFRAQLAGYKCVFAPQARIYHRLGASGGGSLASYLCGRNFISVIVKNMPARLLRRYWWQIIAGQLRFTAQALWHIREPAARARLRGQVAGLFQIPKMIPKRKGVLALKRVSDDYIESILS